MAKIHVNSFSYMFEKQKKSEKSAKIMTKINVIINSIWEGRKFRESIFEQNNNFYRGWPKPTPIYLVNWVQNVTIKYTITTFFGEKIPDKCCYLLSSSARRDVWQENKNDWREQVMMGFWWDHFFLSSLTFSSSILNQASVKLRLEKEQRMYYLVLITI